jgi:uncharacterized membrane protein YGL010W
MQSLEQSLVQYAAYHRDRRNIATHFAGIPMIVFAAVLALDTASFTVAGWTVSVAALVSIAACVYYLSLDARLGIAMAVALFLMCAGASELHARLGTGLTLGAALAIFAAGWALQFLGHKYEGMKPAFFDDARQLLIGPLFVCAEAAFLLGMRPALRQAIEQRVGPTVARRDGAPLPLVPH